MQVTQALGTISLMIDWHDLGVEDEHIGLLIPVGYADNFVEEAIYSCQRLWKQAGTARQSHLVACCLVGCWKIVEQANFRECFDLRLEHLFK